jgi:CBS domain containing-hemolysin-like protein
MSLVPWAEAGLSLIFLVLAALARAAALGSAPGDAPSRPERALGGPTRSADALAAELLWAVLLASFLLLAAHAVPVLAPALPGLTALWMLAAAALVLADAAPARWGRSWIERGNGRLPGLRLVEFLARPFRSLAAGLAHAPVNGSAAEPAAADEEKLIARLLDATNDGETGGQEGDTAIVRRLLGRVLHLRETPVGSLMCPRSEIVWIGHRERPAAAALLMRESGHTRLPVCGRDLDDVIGVLHLKDVFIALHGVPPEATAGSIGREPSFVDVTAPLSALLAGWRHQAGTMSIVRDEDGRVVGLITLGDVLGWLLPAPGIESVTFSGAVPDHGLPPGGPTA